MFQTLSQIKDNNFSVAIFAPGWTFESNNEIINIDSTKGEEICNKMFLEKDNFLWSKMWQYLNTYGINTLPFYSSFCIGSGKTKKRHGATISTNHWFNLSEQQYQPSVPGHHHFSYYFEDAFDGGSCLKINQIDEIIRIFTCDYDIQENGFIASLAFKRNNHNFDLDLHLVLYNEDTNQTCSVICTDMPFPSNTPGRIYLTSIVDETILKEIHQSLKLSNQKCISTSSPINDWETRFFIICLEDIRGKVVDIGVNIISNGNEHFSSKYHNILLGAMSFHNGVLGHEDLGRIPKVCCSF